METDTIGDGQAELSSEMSAGGPYLIHGRVMAPGDKTYGKSKTWKKWTEEALSEAASTLKGKNLVRDHINDRINSVIGEVTESKYRKGEGVLFEAELDDKDIAQQVGRGRLDVSARLSHPDIDELEEDSDGNKVVDKIKEFLNLSLVPDGASPSNKVNSGPAESLSATELAAAFDHTPSQTDENDAHELAEEKKDDTPSDTTEENTSNSEASDGEVVELAATHSPSYSGTSSSGEWSSLAMEDFDTDDLSEISGHFLATKTEFPPNNFGDLSLEVVNPSGDLVLGGLDSAWKTASSVDGLSEEQISSVKTTIANLAQDEFPESDLADRVSDSDNTEENESESEEDTEELDEEAESDNADEGEDSDPEFDFSNVSVMSNEDFEGRLNGERSTETEENQRYKITVDI